jgi:hypothetical protein
MTNAAHSARSHPFLILGAGVLAGLALYGLYAAGERSPNRSPQRRSNRRRRS